MDRIVCCTEFANLILQNGSILHRGWRGVCHQQRFMYQDCTSLITPVFQAKCGVAVDGGGVEMSNGIFDYSDLYGDDTKLLMQVCTPYRLRACTDPTSLVTGCRRWYIPNCRGANRPCHGGCENSGTSN